MDRDTSIPAQTQNTASVDAPTQKPTRSHLAWARRLGAAVTECVLDSWGHAGLAERLVRPSFNARFSALLGLDPSLLQSVLRYGLAHDLERLDLDDHALTPRCMTAHATLHSAGVVPLFGRPIAVASGPDPRLAAANQVAFGPLPDPVAKLARKPLLGTRSVFALALLSELVALESTAFVDDQNAVLRAQYAFGSDVIGGSVKAPYAFSPPVANAVLITLEALLHRNPPNRRLPNRRLPNQGPQARQNQVRTQALLALFTAVRELEGHVAPTSGPSLVRRHERLVQNLPQSGALPRKPKRFAMRNRQTMPSQPQKPVHIGDAQGDLFAW